jgi:hypothetical protein
MEKMLLSEAKALMESIDPLGNAIPFKIGFNTFNVELQTGGEFVKFDFCIKAINLKKGNNKKTFFKGYSEKREVENSPSKKRQNHDKNQTTNLAILAKSEIDGKLVFTGNIYKIHYRLITQLNEKEIIW